MGEKSARPSRNWVPPDRFAGGRSPEQKPTFMLSEEVSRPAHGTQIYVFGLPDKMQ